MGDLLRCGIGCCLVVIADADNDLHVVAGVLLDINDGIGSLIHGDGLGQDLHHVDLAGVDEVKGLLKLASAGAGTADVDLLLGDDIGGQAGFLLGPAGQGDAASVGNQIKGLADGGVSAGALHDLMCHLAAGDLFHALNGVLFAGVDDILDTEALGKVKALLHEIEQNSVGTVSLGDHTGNQTDGACTDDGAVLAGLQAAATLLQLGYEVEIFEKADRAGGFLRTIPEYRLPETVVDGEIERVVALGAVIHCGVDVDKAKFEELKAGYDAVLVATGVRKPMILDLFQGNPNVVSAVDLLTEIRSKHGEMNVPASALVLGGGDSAMDAATTLKMLGVKDVIEVTRNEFRASDAEKATAHEMGVITIGGYTPAAVDGKTVTFKHSRLNSELKIEAELIVVALGQNIDNELGLPVERNEVVAEGTSVDGKVFVAGDIAKGDKTVVAAVNKGKLAAYEIHNRIGG